MKRTTTTRLLCILLSFLMSVAAFSAAVFTVSADPVPVPDDTKTERDLVVRWASEGINTAAFSEGVHATYGSEVTGRKVSGGSSTAPTRNVDTGVDTVLGWGFGAVISNYVFHSVSVPFNTVTPNVGDSYTVKVKVNVTLKGNAILPLAGHANSDTESVVGVVLNGKTVWWTGLEYDALPTYTDSEYGYEYKILEVTYTRTETDTGNDQVRLKNVSNGFISYAFAYGVDVYTHDGSLYVTKGPMDMYNATGIGVMGGDWGGAWLINAGHVFYSSAAGQATSQAGCDGSANNMWGLYHTFAAQGKYELQYVLKFDNITGENLAKITANIPAESGVFGTHIITASEVEAGVGEGYFGVYTIPFNFTGQGDSRVEPLMSFYDNADVSLVEIRLVKAFPAAASVIAKIDAIGTVTAGSGDAIEAARTAYDALSPEDQALVTNYTVLTDAEAAYASIQAAASVVAKIDAIGTVTEASGAAIAEARAAYDALSAEDRALVTNYSVLTVAEKAYDALLYPTLVSPNQTVAHWGMDKLKDISASEDLKAVYGSEVTGIVASGGTSWVPDRNIDTSVDTVLGYGYGAVVQNYVVYGADIPMALAAPNEGDTFTVKVKANVLLRPSAGQMSTHANTAGAVNVVGLNLDPAAEGIWWTGDMYDALPAYVDSQYGYEYKILETTLTNTEAVGSHVQFRMVNVSNGFVTYAFCFGFEVYNDQTGEVVYSKTGMDLYDANGCGVMGGDWAGSWYIESGLAFYKSAEGKETSQAGCDGTANNLWGLYYTPEDHGFYAMEYVMKIDDIGEGEEIAAIAVNSPAEGIIADSKKVITASEVEAAGTDGRFAIYTTGAFNYTGSGDGRIEPIVSFYDNANVYLTDIRLVKINAIAVVENLIAAIGTVTKASGAAIAEARAAYDALSAEDRALVTNYNVLTAAEKAYDALLYPTLVSPNQTVAHWGMDKLKDISASEDLKAVYGSEVTGIVASGGTSWVPGRNIDTSVDTVLGYGYGAVVPNYVVYGADIPMALAAPNEGDTFTVKVKANVLLGSSAGQLSSHPHTAGTANVVGLDLSPASDGIIWWTGDTYDALPAYVDTQYGYEYKILETTLTNTEAVGSHVQFRMVNVSNGFVSYAFCFGFEVYNDQTGEVVYSKTGMDLYDANGCGVMGGDWAGSWYIESGLAFYKSTEGKETSQAGCDGTANNLWGLYYTPEDHGFYAMEYVMKIDDIGEGEEIAAIAVNSPAEGTIADSKKVITASEVETAGTDGRFAIYTTGAFNYTGSGDGRIEPIVSFYDNANVYLTDIRLVKIELSPAAIVENLIAEIGTVTVSSGAKIAEARAAYDELSPEDQALVTNYNVLTAAEKAYDALLYPTLVSPNQTVAHWGMDKLKDISASEDLKAVYGSEVTGIVASGGTSWVPGRNIDTSVDTVLGYGYGAVIENYVVYGADIPMALAAPSEGDTFTVKVKANVLLRPSAGQMSAHANTAGATNVVGLELSPAAEGKIWWTGDMYDALPTYVNSQYGYEYKILETTLTNTEAVGTHVQFRMVNVSNGFVTYAFCFGLEVYNDQTGEMVYSKSAMDLYNANGCGVMGGDWAGSWYIESGLAFYKSAEGKETSQAGCDGTANNLWGLYYKPEDHGFYAMEYVMKIDDIGEGEEIAAIAVNSPAEGTIADSKKVITASEVETAGTDGRFAIYTTGAFNYTGSGDGRIEPIVSFYDNANVYLTDIRLVKVEIDPVTEAENLIDAIGTVTKDSGPAIEAARDAYDELSAEDQDSVSNYEVLTDAEAAYAEILEDIEAAEAVEAKIAAIGTVTLESGPAIAEARAAYDGLTSAQKAYVGNYETLTNAEAAHAVITKIAAIGTVTLESGPAIAEARTAYDGLTPAQKDIVGETNFAILKKAEKDYDDLPSIVYGDINGDKDVTAADALLALQHAVKKITLEDDKLTVGDVDGKDGVTATDALLILQHSVKKISSFPVERTE